MEQDVRNLVQELEARWKSLTIANDFVFGKVMLDEDLCKVSPLTSKRSSTLGVRMPSM